MLQPTTPPPTPYLPYAVMRRLAELSAPAPPEDDTYSPSARERRDDLPAAARRSFRTDRSN